MNEEQKKYSLLLDAMWLAFSINQKIREKEMRGELRFGDKLLRIGEKSWRRVQRRRSMVSV